MLPRTCAARIDLDAVTPPPVFGWLAGQGRVAEREMLRTFNCGIGMVIVVDPARRDAVVAALRAAGEAPLDLGHIVPREGEAVVYDGRLAL